MKPNSKIYVKDYLRRLNVEVDNLVKKHHLKYNSCDKLTCKSLAERCEVTSASISNLSTSSKYDLIYKIACEIYDAYYSYFIYQDEKDKFTCVVEEEYCYVPNDVSHIIYELTEFYSDLPF